MKLVLEPVTVTVRDHVPVAFHWRGRELKVEAVLDRWFWRGRWWHDSALQGEVRHYYRVRVGTAVYELCCSAGIDQNAPVAYIHRGRVTEPDRPPHSDHSSRRWHISRRFD